MGTGTEVGVAVGVGVGTGVEVGVGAGVDVGAGIAVAVGVGAEVGEGAGVDGGDGGIDTVVGLRGGVNVTVGDGEVVWASSDAGTEVALVVGFRVALPVLAVGVSSDCDTN